MTIFKLISDNQSKLAVANFYVANFIDLNRFRIMSLVWFDFCCCSWSEMNTIDTRSLQNPKARLKKLLFDYSVSVKNYAKWFEITQVNKNQETFTTYKVIYRVFIELVSFFLFFCKKKLKLKYQGLFITHGISIKHL